MSITDSSSDADRGGRSVGTSNDGGEFYPGQIIAGRFRIVVHRDLKTAKGRGSLEKSL